VDPGWQERTLRVAPEFTAPRQPELEARVQADRAAFALAYAHPPTPPLFSKPFDWPRAAKVTARFGERRTYNGETASQHYGTDLAGPVGAAVRAANAGEVVLVRDAWASGLSVVLFHGANLYTAYFHLSAAAVEPGERVARGQVIGRLGGSGRSTGPHLHWGAKVGDLYVDPESLLRLTGGPPRPSPRR
jgi:murein DD-endopeptidase MepM/ murein hydrolase activator NlpD